ncbi:hypothetical protein T01_8731 [Trichinella spiralis]|uniref:Uncharacterized protein n=1 Tax=Trichinella spiralis TaxID=6334 RepID=A0A0V1ANL8_TRISP|nr:hypothetical protein T01_8731 [Trichinella spiralis]
MLHLTHRTLDVFWQLRHRFFWFIISGQCANLSNLAAVLGSGLLTRLLLVSAFAVEVTRPRDFLSYALFTFVKASATSNVKCIKSFWLLLAASLALRSLLYCSHPFTTATWSVQKKILLYHFLLHWSLRYNARNMPAKSTPPMYLLYSFTIAGQDTSIRVVCKRKWKISPPLHCRAIERCISCFLQWCRHGRHPDQPFSTLSLFSVARSSVCFAESFRWCGCLFLIILVAGRGG